MTDSPARSLSLQIDDSRPIEFSFDGKPVSGFAGDTIASALYRSGVWMFSRSFKYHRPRGLLCASGACPNCLVDVDGVPNERACTTELQPGMQVARQNVWPSSDFDVMSITDRFSPFLPVGFYYKIFHYPRLLWPVFETVLRNAAGLGKLRPDPDSAPEDYFDKQYMHCEVAVVGGGAAAMQAALAAAEAGARVVLACREPHLGGSLRYHHEPLQPLDFNATNSAALAAEMARACDAHPRITVLRNANVFANYEGNMLPIAIGRRLYKLRAAQFVAADERQAQPLVFHNNDLPGVMLGDAAERLMHLYGVRPGERALVVTATDEGWQVAASLLEFGVQLSAVVDARADAPGVEAAERVQAAGVPVHLGSSIVAAEGRSQVEAAQIAAIDDDGQPVGATTRYDCDLICVSTSFAARSALLFQAGGKLAYDIEIDDFAPVRMGTGSWGAGSAVGTVGTMAALLEGKVVGYKAALAAGLQSAVAEQGIARYEPQLASLKAERRARLRVRPLASVAGDKKRFVCFCEDVTEHDIEDAVAEGFDDIQTLKRYSTISMGPCQGKLCNVNSIRLLAKHTDRTIVETGTTTARPPHEPASLGVLAGRKLEPVRYTPMHQRHLVQGAVWLDAGQWKRPFSYGDPHAEVRAVRQAAGMIDVSTLGKLDVQGPDAATLLERLYTNRFARLGVGRVRYGLMVSDEGIVLDDGVVARLAEQHYVLTTTSGGSGSVFEWLTWWLATWPELRVHVTNVTSDYAAINVAGPEARDLLAPMTDLDLSTAAFPYMHAREGLLAGVPARLMRIGFVGELGYEIHVPASYGAWLWDQLLAAGIRPFGMEAQRILRLEKGHIIVGQDTDALSDPFGANMPWVVKLDKGEFIGKPSLARLSDTPPAEQLVAFVMADANLAPHEGEQMIDGDGNLIGRVTSSRYSPTLNQAIGLGWVRADLAKPGTVLTIPTRGLHAHATVFEGVFYDADGARQKA